MYSVITIVHTCALCDHRVTSFHLLVPKVAGKIVGKMLEMKNTELLLLLANKDELYNAFLEHLRRYKEMYYNDNDCIDLYS